jgi:hypothetical protein
MRVILRLIGAAPLLFIGPSVHAASSASFGNTISLEVPVTCKLVHRGTVSQRGNEYDLGQLLAYCNSPRGFFVQLDYQPGSFRGAVVRLGAEEVTLDGSGHSEVMRSNGPKISTADVTAVAGPSGFDTAALQFEIVPL